MAKRRTAPKKKPAEHGPCDRLANDMQRLASTTLQLSQGAAITGSIMGPPGREIFYEIKCGIPAKRGELDGGRCGTYRIERSGPGSKGLRKTADVGNIYGLARQLSRDAARAHGLCSLQPTPGFEGVRPRRRRRRR